MSFIVAGMAIVVLMFLLALLLASAREHTVEALQSGAPAVRRWGGRVLLAVGAWFIVLGAFAGFFADLFPV